MIGANSHGARTYTFLASEIVEALKKNRAEHQEIVEEAQKGFEEKVILELKKALADAKAGRAFRTLLGLDMPRSYLREYDNAIDVLEATQRAGTVEIDLTADEYERFVRNRWDWMMGFATLNSKYSAKAQKMSQEM
ncbi:MAG: hypothetical protein Q8P59_13100 [Dehalococcoidia bacterium]|nr:hypothetical protein [Dehalococcoidia bacterium]